jgi:sugar phosphate permease
MPRRLLSLLPQVREFALLKQPPGDLMIAVPPTDLVPIRGPRVTHCSPNFCLDSNLDPLVLSYRASGKVFSEPELRNTITNATRNRSSRQVFPGWWIVLATGFVTFWAHGYYTQGFSALFRPLSTDLGLSRATTSVASSIGSFAAGIEAPLAGWFTDRFGPRRVIFFGTLLMGLGLMSMWLVNSTWAFFLVWGGIVATGLNVGMAIPVDKAISNWFVRKRGLALSARALMQGLATMAVLPMIAWLLTVVGWKATCLFGGAVMCLVGLPLVWLLVKDQRPEFYGMMPDGAAAPAASEADRADTIRKGIQYAEDVQEFEFTLRQAIRTRAYWVFTAAFACSMLVTGPLMVHMISFLTDLQVTPVRAALMMSLASAAAIPTRLLGGWLADRAGKQRMRFVAVGAFLLMLAGIIVFQLLGTVAAAFVMVLLYYFGFTAGIPLASAIRVRYFGRKSIGSVQGSAVMIMMPFTVLAPILVGWIYDRTGSYSDAFNLFIGLLILASLLMLFAAPPKPPAETRNISAIL